jgi:hypothetical protein
MSASFFPRSGGVSTFGGSVCLNTCCQRPLYKLAAVELKKHLASSLGCSRAVAPRRLGRTVGLVRGQRQCRAHASRTGRPPFINSTNTCGAA